MKKKIKLPFKTVLLVFIVCICCWIAAVGQNQRPSPNRATAGGELQAYQEIPGQDPETQTRQTPITLPKEESTVMEEEDFIGDEQEPWSRKLFQKKLPPLGKKAKIVWSFRMAVTNTFL